MIGLWCFTPLSTIFQLYRGSVWKKPLIWRKSLTNFYHTILYPVHLTMNELISVFNQTIFELTECHITGS